MDLTGLARGSRMVPQILGRRGPRMAIDASFVEKRIDDASGLTLFPIGGVMTDPNAVFLGFGKPNTYLTVPRPADESNDGGWNKFAAFMFWRKRSYVANTKGRVQSGVLVQLLDVGQDTIAKLNQAMAHQSNKRGPSCAHSNALVLDEAGFTCGGKRLTRVYRPSKLFSLIWRNGLELDGKPVELRIIYTDSEVSDHFVSVWRRECTSLCRTVKKKFHRADDTHAPAPVFDLSAEVKPAGELPSGGHPISLGMSRPSDFGAYLGFVFGTHPIFVGEPDLKPDAPELSTPLEPFPGELDRVTRIKKYALFSRPVVRVIRRNLMESTEHFPAMPGRAVIDMMRTSDSADPDSAFKYNIALTGSKIYLTRLENRNGRDWKKINWLLAKHVLTVGYDPDVRFSGEGWKCVDADGTPTLYLTRNSGTYQPGLERLQPAGDYAAELFGIRVVCVD